MGIKRTIEIDGQQVTFKASAAIPRIYRLKFHRDIYKDLAALEKSVGDNSEGSSGLDMFSLEMFENIAYIMAKHADPAAVPDSPEDWLDSFNTFSIYQVLPQLIELPRRGAGRETPFPCARARRAARSRPFAASRGR